jgi:hypothetical protein
MSSKPKAKAKTITVYRSSVTGRFIKPGVAKRYPKTSVKQQVRVPTKKK